MVVSRGLGQAGLLLCLLLYRSISILQDHLMVGGGLGQTGLVVCMPLQHVVGILQHLVVRSSDHHHITKNLHPLPNLVLQLQLRRHDVGCRCLVHRWLLGQQLLLLLRQRLYHSQAIGPLHHHG